MDNRSRRHPPHHTRIDPAGLRPPLPKPAAAALIDHHVGQVVSPQSLLTLCTSNVRGSPTLLRQLREAATNFASEPERLFARALHERGLHPLPNHPIGNYYADFYDEPSHTIIEIDGREFHSAPTVFRQDRRRQNALLLSGYLVLRYAAADIFHSLPACADEAATVIRRRRRARWKP
ncbi:endonuclease domain-containing protein [Nocardia inohanensis]|uniref:endonuclease domain-containing protein n=1 Tax=Nocardia inohanensis TaxID=209246 RepID=UPI00350E4D3A